MDAVFTVSGWRRMFKGCESIEVAITSEVKLVIYERENELLIARTRGEIVEVVYSEILDLPTEVS